MVQVSMAEFAAELRREGLEQRYGGVVGRQLKTGAQALQAMMQPTGPPLGVPRQPIMPPWPSSLTNSGRTTIDSGAAHLMGPSPTSPPPSGWDRDSSGAAHHMGAQAQGMGGAAGNGQRARGVQGMGGELQEQEHYLPLRVAGLVEQLQGWADACDSALAKQTPGAFV